MARDSGQRARQILLAAEKLLKHYGFNKTTVSDIAREAAVGVGTVYLHFASKDDIVAALAAQRHEHVLRSMRRVAQGSGPYGDRLRVLLEVRLEHFARYLEDGQHGRDLVSCACPAVGQIHDEFRRAERELLSGFLEQATRAGEFDVSDHTLVARMILQLCDQITDDGSLRRDGQEMSRRLRVTHEVLLRGLAIR